MAHEELEEPLSAAAARDLVRRLIGDGFTRFSKHAQEEMDSDDLQETDVLNVLRNGWVYQPAELENGFWRYRLETDRIAVVVAFRSSCTVVVVTAWRKKQRGR